VGEGAAEEESEEDAEEDAGRSEGEGAQGPGSSLCSCCMAEL